MSNSHLAFFWELGGTGFFCWKVGNTWILIVVLVAAVGEILVAFGITAEVEVAAILDADFVAHLKRPLDAGE